jgi:hypothetical protein
VITRTVRAERDVAGVERDELGTAQRGGRGDDRLQVVSRDGRLSVLGGADRSADPCHDRPGLTLSSWRVVSRQTVVGRNHRRPALNRGRPQTGVRLSCEKQRNGLARSRQRDQGVLATPASESTPVGARAAHVSADSHPRDRVGHHAGLGGMTAFAARAPRGYARIYPFPPNTAHAALFAAPRVRRRRAGPILSFVATALSLTSLVRLSASPAIGDRCCRRESART